LVGQLLMECTAWILHPIAALTGCAMLLLNLCAAIFPSTFARVCTSSSARVCTSNCSQASSPQAAQIHCFLHVLFPAGYLRGAVRDQHLPIGAGPGAEGARRRHLLRLRLLHRQVIGGPHHAGVPAPSLPPGFRSTCCLRCGSATSSIHRFMQVCSHPAIDAMSPAGHT
jgi:hypothetical protein